MSNYNKQVETTLNYIWKIIISGSVLFLLLITFFPDKPYQEECVQSHVEVKTYCLCNKNEDSTEFRIVPSSQCNVFDCMIDYSVNESVCDKYALVRYAEVKE